MGPTDQPFSNATGASWSRASLSGNGLMYHTYNSEADADTAISGPIVLAALADGFHYELDTEEYIAYGGDANDICGIAGGRNQGNFGCIPAGFPYFDNIEFFLRRN